MILIAGAPAAFAQPVQVGARVGVPLTGFFTAINGSLDNNSDRYIIGPSLELRLPFGFGVEADALYRKLSYRFQPGEQVNTANASQWEFPILAKYRFRWMGVRPCLDAGFALSTLSGIKNTYISSLGVSTRPVATNNGKGFVVGGGVDIHVLRIQISPEIRYTRWGEARFEEPVNSVRGNRNQAEFLVGITF